MNTPLIGTQTEADTGPGTEATTVDLSGLAYELQTLRELDATIAELTGRREVLVETLKNVLAENDAEAGTIGGRHVVRWSWVRTQRLSQSAVKKDYPEVYLKCLTRTEHRRFTVVAPHGEGA